ncbi:MAG: hypothetical protein ACE363_11715 [Alphaproteobacteria bacterium]
MRITGGWTAAVAALFLGIPGTVLAQTCEPTADRHAVKIKGQTDDGVLNEHLKPEIYGNHNFTQDLGNGWWFHLGAAKYGWVIYVFGRDEAGADVDMTQITPPFRGPNPRQLYGWHFRNQANTGPNEGDVNAPQHDRVFLFSPSLIGSGGFKPPQGAVAPPEPDSRSGLGWLKILDYGLSDLEPGQQARMTYLKFDACITWPKSDEEQQREAAAADPDFMPEERETFGSCGLDLSTYDLSAAILPRQYGGDIDGDDALDEVAQIRRKSDGKRGLALCRAGTWLHVLGMDGKPVGKDLQPGYFDQMEVWNWVPKTGDLPPYIGDRKRPQSDGDILVLERVEKQVILLFWRNGELHSEQVYGYVEP